MTDPYESVASIPANRLGSRSYPSDPIDLADHDHGDAWQHTCELCGSDSTDPMQSVQLEHKRYPVELCRACVHGVALYAVARILMLSEK